MTASVSMGTAGKEGTFGLSRFNEKLSFQLLMEALDAASRRPTGYGFADIEWGSAARARIEAFLTESTTDEPWTARRNRFVGALSKLCWLNEFPLVQEIDKTVFCGSGPVWLYDADLCRGLISPDNADSPLVLQAHVGFNYFAQEVLWKDTRLLTVRLHCDSRLSQTLDNTVMVAAHEGQGDYEQTLSSFTRYQIEDLLPPGLVLGE